MSCMCTGIICALLSYSLGLHAVTSVHFSDEIGTTKQEDLLYEYIIHAI